MCAVSNSSRIAYCVLRIAYGMGDPFKAEAIFLSFRLCSESVVCEAEILTKVGMTEKKVCPNGSALRGYRETNDNGPHPLNPPLPTEGSGEDLTKTRQKSSIFVWKTPPNPPLGEGVGG